MSLSSYKFEHRKKAGLDFTVSNFRKQCRVRDRNTIQVDDFCNLCFVVKESAEGLHVRKEKTSLLTMGLLT